MLAASLLLAWVLSLGGRAHASHPNALWHVVHDLCLRDARLIGRPAPCLAVNRRVGYAVVPDPRRRTQVLLVPTRRISGIESPALLEPDSVNYWQAAWDARVFFERRARRQLPRDQIGMAINSIASRSQNQLHIHVDCLRASVVAYLKAHEGEIGPIWRPLPDPLVGRHYAARRLLGAELDPRDPFKLLAEGNPSAPDHMGRFSLAVVGATFSDGSPGFYLLADDGPAAFAEGLLDHTCAGPAAP
jgi:CDP-diacylglycerol pyrophosphatase